MSEKTISRQRKWQLEQQALGKCVQCGATARVLKSGALGVKCEICEQKNRKPKAVLTSEFK